MAVCPAWLHDPSMGEPVPVAPLPPVLVRGTFDWWGSDAAARPHPVPAPPPPGVFAQQRGRYADAYARNRWRFRVRYDCRQRRYSLRTIAERLGMPLRGRTILDVGFGSGDLLFLADPSCRVCGVELSRSAIDRARATAARRGYRDFDFREAREDGRLDYPDGFFDLAICSHVLEHVPNDLATLAEIRRVLRPRGLAFLFVPVEPEGFDPKHERQYGVRSLVKRVEAAGLRAHYVEGQMRWAWPVKFLEVPDLHGGGAWAQACDALRHVLALPLPMRAGEAFDRLLARVGVPETQALVVAAPA